MVDSSAMEVGAKLVGVIVGTFVGFVASDGNELGSATGISVGNAEFGFIEGKIIVGNNVGHCGDIVGQLAEGSPLGKNVGSFEGCAIGFNVGSACGEFEGSKVGSFEGCTLGTTDGSDIEGQVDGFAEGNVGQALGMDDVGSPNVGAWDGQVDGFAVGARVGMPFVGVVVGRWLGSSDRGHCVG